MPHDYQSILDELEDRATVKPQNITSGLIAGLKDAERQAMQDEAMTGKAIKLEPGCVYAIECDYHMTREQQERVQQRLEPYEKEHGVKFVVLSKGLHLVRERTATDVPSTP